MFNFLPHTDETRQEMLSDIGLNSIENLFENIPSEVRIKENDLNLSEGLSELQALNLLKELANKNKIPKLSFLGGGTYNRYIPASVPAVLSRSEFVTSYTPYQPEVSQGTLRAIFDYQTMICNLTGMDVSNASMYDGATACAEAISMATRINRKNKVLVSPLINANYKKVIETYSYGTDIQIEYLEQSEGLTVIPENINPDDYAGILIQSPNYLGCVENTEILGKQLENSKTKLIVSTDPVSLAVLESPSKFGADIIIGDLQPLGISMNFGGPHCGFFACKESYLRQMPGRIVGKTVDKEGNTAYTLTVQTREQHIKRARATSNICTNQALMALAATVYLASAGPVGLQEVANISTQRAHYMAEKINQIEGLTILYSNFLNEFVIKSEKIPAKELLAKLKEKEILLGINLEEKEQTYKNCILTAVTEMNEIEDIDKTIKAIESII